MKPFVTVLQAALVASTLALSAHAAPGVAWSSIDATVWSNLIDFESAGVLANDTPVANQFLALGVVFSGSVLANSCAVDTWNPYNGMSGTTLNTYGPGCMTNSSNETFSMKFSADVSAVRLDTVLYDASAANNLPQRDTFGLYNDGQRLATLSLIDAPYPGLTPGVVHLIKGREFFNFDDNRSGFLTVDGGGQLFDELRFTEVHADRTDTYLVFDNLRFNLAPAVPEPTTQELLLAGIALLAVGAARRGA